MRRKHPNIASAAYEATRNSAKRTRGHGGYRKKLCNTSTAPDQLNPFLIVAAGTPKQNVSIEKCNRLVENYIIKEMRPLSTVNKPAFRDMVHGLSNGVFVPVCQQTLTRRLLTRFQECQSKVARIIGESEYVCTTADIWSKNNKSFMGVTAHIISENLNRQSFVLACQRIEFSHTHTEIAKTLNEIHSNFNIKSENAVGTVIDNLKNFDKALNFFSDHFSIELDNENNDIAILDISFSQICDGINDVIYLPPQFRCCSHTLNLIATTDIPKAVSRSAAILRKVYYSVFEKLSAIWNSVSRSTKAYDLVELICNRKLNVPCPTRWNSQLDSIKTILDVREFLDQICLSLSKPSFKSLELEFLEDYHNVLKPLAIAIDTLQAEKESYLGYVIPTLLQLLYSESKMVNLTFCSELRDSIIENVNTRFQKILDFQNEISRPYIFSTCSLPTFKLNWINKNKDEKKYFLIKDLFRNEIIKQFVDINTVIQVESTAPQDSFSFDFMESVEKVPNTENSATIELLAYLECPSKDLQMLKSYPTVLKVFKKYNVILPSSAPVERMFSTGGKILTPIRNKLTEENFEHLLFLKNNEDFENL